MLYLEETFNLSPASPATLDLFVDFAREQLLPVYKLLGTRITVAWTANVEWFSQVTHLIEFDSLTALDRYRNAALQNPYWVKCEVRLDEFAPVRRSRLLEPLGPVPPEALNEAIEQSHKTPLGVYFLAVLEVLPGKMPQFIAGLESGWKNLPIIASWRPVFGNRNEVIDMWKGAMNQSPYKPADERTRQFFKPLREIAPRERIVPVVTLPYSSLQ